MSPKWTKDSGFNFSSLALLQNNCKENKENYLISSVLYGEEPIQYNDEFPSYALTQMSIFCFSNTYPAYTVFYFKWQ